MGGEVRAEKDKKSTELDANEQLRLIAKSAIELEYGDAWEQHRHSKFMDDLGNWHGEGSREHHEICPWPNIDHVIDVVLAAVTENGKVLSGDPKQQV